MNVPPINGNNGFQKLLDTAVENPRAVAATVLALGVLCFLYNRRSSADDYSKPRFPISPVVQLTAKQNQRISELKANKDVQGIIYATHKTARTIHPQYVKIEGDPEGKMEFRSYDLDTNKQTAGAFVYPIRQNHQDGFYNRDFLIFMDCQAEFGPQKALQTKIHLSELRTSNEDLEGLGVGLIQSILQKYGEEFNGRMDTSAGYKAHGFYYKLGFRSPREDVNRRIRQNMGNTAELLAQNMYLPEPLWKKWRQHIQKHPIQFPQ